MVQFKCFSESFMAGRAFHWGTITGKVTFVESVKVPDLDRLSLNADPVFRCLF